MIQEFDFSDYFPTEEDNAPIQFHSEDVDFSLANPQLLYDWIKYAVENEEKTFTVVNFIFCSDNYLHNINVEYLQHDYFTDVITFPYLAPPMVEGDIFISVDRVKDNAEQLGVSFEQELHRVMIHGVLHLCGYLDKSDVEAKQMRTKEDFYLSKLESLQFPFTDQL